MIWSRVPGTLQSHSPSGTMPGCLHLPLDETKYIYIHIHIYIFLSDDHGPSALGFVCPSASLVSLPSPFSALIRHFGHHSGNPFPVLTRLLPLFGVSPVGALAGSTTKPTQSAAERISISSRANFSDSAKIWNLAPHRFSVECTGAILEPDPVVEAHGFHSAERNVWSTNHLRYYVGGNTLPGAVECFAAPERVSILVHKMTIVWVTSLLLFILFSARFLALLRRWKTPTHANKPQGVCFHQSEKL